MFLSKRSVKLELMDLGIGLPQEIHGAYRLIAYVNRFLGGTRTVLRHLERYAPSWKKGETLRILDVGAGGSDIPRAIADWARARSVRVFIVALDVSREALTYSASVLSGYPEVVLVEASAFDPPFARGTFDYVISSMFFHHLTDSDAVRLLTVFDTLAARGIVVNDLFRSVSAFVGIWLMARLTANRLFRHDAPLSVARSYRREDAESLARGAGLPYLAYHRHPFHRFALAGEKSALCLPAR